MKKQIIVRKSCPSEQAAREFAHAACGRVNAREMIVGSTVWPARTLECRNFTVTSFAIDDRGNHACVVWLHPLRDSLRETLAAHPTLMAEFDFNLDTRIDPESRDTQIRTTLDEMLRIVEELAVSEEGYLPYCDDPQDGCAELWSEELDEFTVAAQRFMEACGRGGLLIRSIAPR
jgi:hypothetical protein